MSYNADLVALQIICNVTNYVPLTLCSPDAPPMSLLLLCDCTIDKITSMKPSRLDVFLQQPIVC